jgi:hypothetical protein
MSWNQSYHIEQMDRFLARLVGIDVDKLIADETARRMAEQDVQIARVEDMGRVDDMFGPDEPLLRVTLSDGRTFIHRMVRSEGGDDWGHDDWEFRPEDERVVPERVYHGDDAQPLWPDEPDEWEEP